MAGAARDDESALKTTALRLLESRKQLPIWTARKALVRLIAEHDTIVLVGETGSGKTTQTPQFVARNLAPAGLVACTQPRRVAAITVATRVAAEFGSAVGGAVGYAVRFDDRTSPDTRVKYMTDGILIREAIGDPLLSRYSVVHVDEAHERSVNTDVLLGLLKRAQRARSGSDTSNITPVATKKQKRRKVIIGPLKLIVMSATLAQDKFVAFFPGAVPAFVEGRQHPVDVLYTRAPQESYLHASVTAAFQVHLDEPDGTILAFLPGQDDIEAAAAALTALAASHAHPAGLQLHCIPLYAALPPEDQAAAFVPAAHNTRNVVLATNIAETSVTLPGVRYVVDSGTVKARSYSVQRGVDALEVMRASQAQAAQRAGRAGREAPGKCFRLYTEATYATLAPEATPELLRSNLAAAVLQLKAIGVQDVLGFDFLDPPAMPMLRGALQKLQALRALDSKCALTQQGRAMARLPVEPPQAAFLLEAARTGCAADAAALVGMLSADRIFVAPSSDVTDARTHHRAFHSASGDHITLLNVHHQYMAVAAHKRGAWCRKRFLSGKALRAAADIEQQLLEQMQALSPAEAQATTTSGDDNFERLRQALVTGFASNIARRQPDGRFRVVATGQDVYLHPSSALLNKRPKCVVFNELVHTTKLYAQCVSVVDAAWLPAQLAAGTAFGAAQAAARLRGQ